MRSAKYIGRVGALAFALGVGAGLTANPWVASAETPDSGSASASAPSSPGQQSDSNASESKPDSSTSASSKVPKDDVAEAKDVGAADTETADDEQPQVNPAVDSGDESENNDGAAPLAHDEATSKGADVDAADDVVDVNDEVKVDVAKAPESTRASVAPADPAPATTVTDIVSSEDTMAPAAKDAPEGPAEPPALLALAAFSRRESEQAVEQTPASQSSTVALADGPSWDPSLFTGEPSFVSQIFGAVFGFIGAVGTFFGVDLSVPVVKLLSSDSPPWFTTLGLDVKRDEFEGMPVWTLQRPDSTSEEAIVAVHGGALVMHPVVFGWLAYATIAANTGATVMVPIYPLADEGGTARTVMDTMADFISDQIEHRGAQNVSVLGDSAGGNIALVALQELVRRGAPVPSRLVLSSPGLDSTLSNPDIPFVNDPVLSPISIPGLLATSTVWADGLELTDPRVSPLFGSLEGLPPTTVYAGSRDVVMPDVLRLRDKALATPGADFTFVLRNGEFHDWAIMTILPETAELLPDMYRQLGIGTEVSTLTTCDANEGLRPATCGIVAT